jgi:hypothetical protein
MNRSVLALLLVFGVISLRAETRLSGELRSSSLDASGNPYIVDKDISVPAGKQLTIREGCVFLFNGFTGLAVLGDLSVEGSTDKPVIFTSINDGDFNPKSTQLPNPFDWNGIIITRESGSVHMQNFQLRYSVYGIKSQNTLMTIQNGVFRQNGQFHFTMDDKIQYVQDNIPYSYNIGSSTDKTNKSDTVTNKKPAKKSAQSNTRNIIRYSSLGVGVIGLVAGTVFAIEANKTNNRINEINNIVNMDKSQLSKYKSEYETDRDTKLPKEELLTGIFFGLGGVGLAGFVLTFVF